jgi:hypothetical protein
MQALFDAWGVPAAGSSDRFREETAALRKLLCDSWLPALSRDYHGSDAAAKSEKDLPPCRAVAAKPGTQVKSLAALAGAVNQGGDGVWVGAWLTLAASLVSYECFLAWYRFFAQPPAGSQAALRQLLGPLLEAKTWRETIASPFFAAWLAAALAPRLPGSSGSAEPPAQDRPEAYAAELPAGGLDAVLDRWQRNKAAVETARKHFRALRESFTVRLAALGQSVGALPADVRVALETLDKPVAIPAKLQAELDITLHLNRSEGKAGAATRPDPAGGLQPASAPASQELKGKLLKGLSGRFKKL